MSAHHQGGLSEGYKNYIAEKELPDDTYAEDGLALFRVQGSGPENMQAIQVEPVSVVLHFFHLPLIDKLLEICSQHLRHVLVSIVILVYHSLSFKSSCQPCRNSILCTFFSF